MRIRHILSVAILSVGIAVSFFIASDAIKAEAQTPPPQGAGAANIQYPVPELGNCKNEAECRSYCDDSKNAEACFAFAEKHNLMSREEIRAAKKFAKVGRGPGGCTSRDQCDNYCNNSAHINECIAFAEQNGLMSGKELEEAKKVQTAIARGVKPPACGGKSTCDQYCSEPSHMEECITFGQAAGLMSEQEIQDSQKMLAAIKKGAKPPACRGRKECDKYCGDPSHMEECVIFAQAAGFMNEQEAQDSQKMLVALKKGVKPPACRGREECDKYCGEPNHAEECIAFAEAAGFMKPEEAVMARKTGGKGPGGCTSKESCDTFCNDPANQEICFNFGKENGMIPSGDLQRMEEGKKQFSNMLNQAPPEAITCVSNAVGSDNLERFKSGSAMPPRDIGEKIGQCFGQMNQQPGGSGQGQEQRKQFQPGPGATNPGGQIMPQQAGPGGCKTPEECQSFCASNPDVCKNFRPNGESRGEPNGRIEIVPGQSGQGMMPFQPCEGENCKQFAPGGPLRPGEIKNFIEGAAGRIIQGIQPGAPMQGQSLGCAPGTQCGPGPNTPGQAPANQPGMFQGQPGVFIQDQPGNIIPQGTMMPPAEGSAPPPPPAGGSLFESVKSLFGL